MKSWSERQIFSMHQVLLLSVATTLVEAFPDSITGDERPLRCHEVARAVGRVLGLPVIDGKYGIVEHSWLLTRLSGERTAILDCYAVGSLPQVQLHEPGVPGIAVYKPGPLRQDIDEHVVNRLVHSGLPFCPSCNAKMVWHFGKAGKATGYSCPHCGR